MFEKILQLKRSIHYDFLFLNLVNFLMNIFENVNRYVYKCNLHNRTQIQFIFEKNSTKIRKQLTFMNYTAPYASAVPHIALVQQSFQIPVIFYATSIIIQLSFVIFVTVLCIFSLIFRCKGNDILNQQRSQIDSVQNDQGPSKRKDLICFGDIDVVSEQEKTVKRIPNIVELQANSQSQQKHQQIQTLQKIQNRTFGQSFWNMTPRGLNFYGLGKRKIQDDDPTHQIFVQSAVRKFAHQAQQKIHNSSNYRVSQRRIIYLLSFFGIFAVNVNSFDSSIIGVSALAVQVAIFIAFNVFRALKIWKISLLLYFLPTIAVFYEFLQGSHRIYEWNPII